MADSGTHSRRNKDMQTLHLQRLMYPRILVVDVTLDLVQGPEQLVCSVLGSLPSLIQHHGFDPPLRRIFPVEGFFSPLGLIMGSDFIPPNL